MLCFRSQVYNNDTYKTNFSLDTQIFKSHFRPGIRGIVPLRIDTSGGGVNCSAHLNEVW